MECKTDALVLRTVDYGENDKMITLLTADHGKVGAACKGVKKGTAKLKFAAQPFCFAEYVLSERSGRRTVISASLHDGFYPLREDVERFYAASAVCEACNALAYEGMESGALLHAAVSALKEMTEGNPSRSLVCFLMRALAFAGFPVQADGCSGCGGEIKGRLFFDLSSGSFFCGDCAVGTPASESTYHLVRYLQGLPCNKQLLSADGERRALKMLGAYYRYQTEGELCALSEYLKLV